MKAAALFSSLYIVLVKAQGSYPDPVRKWPAAAVVETPAEASVDLFRAETAQLTDDVIADLLDDEDVAEIANLFAFADSEDISERRRMRRASRCKTAPGDLLWPSSSTWHLFDLLLGGALENVVPVASVCYPQSEFGNYDVSECAVVTNEYGVEQTHTESDHSSMFPLYQGDTCPPGINKTASDTCTLGGFPRYSVHAINVAAIQLAVNFARSLNLRLVIKNTGHDYNGRSTGKHALSIWTHNFKDIQFISDYKSSSYSGPVFKVGAGVQGFELYEAAEKYGVTAVGGICPTVGIFGGYSTGGGHSPVMQHFGMGADQVLEMQVVTADGRFRTVSQTSNADLYWAMLGGGGGTFGVITSAVVKVHPEIPVTTSVFSFIAPAPTYWEAVRFFWDSMPAYNSAKTYSYFTLLQLGPGSYLFSMEPFWASNMTVAQFEDLTAAFFVKLADLGIDYNITTKYHSSFYPAYQATFAAAPQVVGATGATPGNRLIPAANWETEDIRTTTFSALQTAVNNAQLVLVYHQAPSSDIPNSLNAVNPAFRRMASMIIAVNTVRDPSPAGLEEAVADLTENILGPLRAVTPDSGAYGNEADIGEPDWQRSFWGDKYERLVSVKRAWDPWGLFYVYHGVGSEEWVVEDGKRGLQTQDGELCRV